MDYLIKLTPWSKTGFCPIMVPAGLILCIREADIESAPDAEAEVTFYTDIGVWANPLPVAETVEELTKILNS